MNVTYTSEQNEPSDNSAPIKRRKRVEISGPSHALVKAHNTVSQKPKQGTLAVKKTKLPPLSTVSNTDTNSK